MLSNEPLHDFQINQEPSLGWLHGNEWQRKNLHNRNIDSNANSIQTNTNAIQTNTNAIQTNSTLIQDASAHLAIVDASINYLVSIKILWFWDQKGVDID